MVVIANLGVGGWYPRGSDRLRTYCNGFRQEFATTLPTR
jgi:hypothetical protein